MSSKFVGDGYEYVRDVYRVDIEVGDLVTVDGEPGVIVAGVGDQYIYVWFDGAHGAVPCHPTWKFVVFQEAR